MKLSTIRRFNPLVLGYYSDESGLVGIRKDGLIHWFRRGPGGMLIQTGSTETEEGATYCLPEYDTDEKENSMSEDFFKKTVVQVEVLSREDWEYIGLDDLVEAITTGDCSGTVRTERIEVMSRKQTAEALINQDSDPAFLLGDGYEEEDGGVDSDSAWISHDSNSMPDFTVDQRVQVRFRNGVYGPERDDPFTYDWRKNGKSFNIIAYQVFED